MATAMAVTARKAHSCTTCDRKDVNGSWSTAILPGHRYLRHVGFPGEEGNEEGASVRVDNECATCAIRRDDFTATSFGICGTYCHGINPCVLPFAKGAPAHDCRCRECGETA